MTQKTLLSTITFPLKKKILIRGTLLAAIGGSLLIFTGSLLPPAILKMVGLLVFLLGGTLIYAGLIPYRTLLQLEKTPSELHLTECSLDFFSQGKLMQSIPWKDMGTLSFEETHTPYRIAVTLKNGKVIHFPYFTKYAYNELIEFKEDLATN